MSESVNADSILLEKFSQLSLANVRKLLDVEEVQQFVVQLFSAKSANFLQNPENCKKAHQVLLQIANRDELYGLTGVRESLARQIVTYRCGSNDGLSVIQTIYYEGTDDHSKDLMAANYVLKLVSSISKDDVKKELFYQLEVDSLKTIKNRSDNIPTVHLHLVLWYLLYTKYHMWLNVNSYESSVPVIMSFTHLLMDEHSPESTDLYNDVNRMFRLIFVRLSELDIQDIILNELETAIVLQTDNGKKLAVLKMYNVLVQTFPRSYTVNIFHSAFFSDFLSDNVKALVRKFYEEKFTLSAVSKQLVISILQVFESITIDETCVATIVKNYLYLIVELSRSSDQLVASLASLVTIKCWNTYQQMKLDKANSEADEQVSLDLQQFFDVFVHCLESESSQKVEKQSIEGLAFISLKVRFKRQIRGNPALIARLEKIIKAQVDVLKSMEDNELENSLSNELIYGALLVVSNIATFNLKLSKEEESIEYLKNYSNANTFINNDERIKNEKLGIQEKDDDEDIRGFLTKLLTGKSIVISSFNGIFKLLTTNIQNQLIRFLYNVSLEKKLRTEVVKQGGLNLLVDYLINDEEHSKAAEYNNYSRLFALRSLAKILISNNPNLVFNKYSVLVVIPFLVELLDDESFHVEDDKVTMHLFIARLVKPLDVFESLLSLTNIASIEDMKIKEIITTKSWKYLENLFLDPNEQIQKAALELVSNLIFCPICASKFFNEQNKDSKLRLEILIKLTNSSNIEIQIVALTIIVNASEYEMIAHELHKNIELFEKLLTILNNIDQYQESQVDQLVLRIVYLLLNIVESVKTDPAKIETIKNYAFKTHTLKTGINKVLHTITDEETLAIVVEICKVLKYI